MTWTTKEVLILVGVMLALFWYVSSQPKCGDADDCSGDDPAYIAAPGE
jgi:hypothetical protein